MKRLRQQWRCSRLPVPCGDRQLAFTLVELLAVIAIIGILAALFLPALSKATQKGWAINCDSNLRQVCEGMRAFAADHDGYYPESGGSIHWGAVDTLTKKAGWMEQIARYVGNTNAFNCPGNVQLPPECQGPFNYFNGCHAALVATGSFAAVKSSAIAYPSLFVLGGDTAGTLKNAAGLQFDPLDADKNDYRHNCIGGAADASLTESWQIHSGGQNVMFADGRSAWYPGYNPREMTFDYTFMADWTGILASDRQ